MKYIQLIILLASLLFFTTPSFAGPSEAEYNTLQESWTLSPDGSQEYRHYEELTLFTHTAMNSAYGETFITYNPRYQELKIHDSYTRQKDGSIVRTPDNAFVEVLPRNAANAPAYNHLKEMVIVHTGLELGATIVLDYSIISRPGYLPAIDVCQPLLHSSPVKEYLLTFSIPADQTLQYETIATSVQPTNTKRGTTQEIKWAFRNLPASSHAPEVSMQNEDVPGIVATTYPSARKAMEILGQQFNPASEVSALASELTRECDTDIQKIQTIHNFILHHLSDCPLTLTETGYQLRPVSTVLQTNYGTEAEKTNLLAALLNACGIQATPAAAYYLPVSSNHCGLHGIQKLVVLAQTDAKPFFLSTQSTSPAATDCNFLLSIPEAQKIVPDVSPAQIQYQAMINWKETKANADVKATFSNNYLSYSPQAENQLVYPDEDLQVIPKASNITVTGKQPIKIVQKQHYLLLTLPETNKGILRLHNYARYNSKRQFNLQLPNVVHENYTYTLTLPDDLSLCTPTKTTRINNKIGSVNISVKQQGQQIEIVHALQLNQKLITPADYPAFKQLITAWSDPNKQQLLLKEKQ